MIANRAKLVTKLLIIIATLILLGYVFGFYLPLAFSGAIVPNPIVLEVFNIQFRWYGLIVASGIAVAFMLSKQKSHDYNIDENKFDIIFCMILLFGFIFARLGFVVQNVDYFKNNMVEVFQIWQGGLSVHGGIIGGILGLLIFAKMLKIDYLKFGNILSPYLLIAAAIGRFGNFFNQEIIGRPTNLAFGQYVGINFRPSQFTHAEYFHPVFLYESILMLIAFFIYQQVSKKVGNRFGILYTIVIYNLIRIIVEFFRADWRPLVFQLDLAQLVSLGLIILMLVLNVFISKSSRNLDN
ncbi:MAG: prolipoprotein diacylglyceryl transferase [bacterium]